MVREGTRTDGCREKGGSVKGYLLDGYAYGRWIEAGDLLRLEVGQLPGPHRVLSVEHDDKYAHCQVQNLFAPFGGSSVDAVTLNADALHRVCVLVKDGDP